MTYRARCIGHKARAGKGGVGSARAIRRQFRKAFLLRFREMYRVRPVVVPMTPGDVKASLSALYDDITSRGWIAVGATGAIVSPRVIAVHEVK